MNKLLSSAVLALALAGAPLAAADARTNLSIGIGIGGPVYAPAPYARRYYHPYSRDDVVLMLSRQGYRIDTIDWRGGSYFVRAYLGPEFYQGYIGGNDGRWIRRDRIAYYPGYRWYGGWHRGWDHRR